MQRDSEAFKTRMVMRRRRRNGFHSGDPVRYCAVVVQVHTHNPDDNDFWKRFQSTFVVFSLQTSETRRSLLIQSLPRPKLSTKLKLSKTFLSAIIPHFLFIFAFTVCQIRRQTYHPVDHEYEVEVRLNGKRESRMRKVEEEEVERLFYYQDCDSRGRQGRNQMSNCG